MVLFRSFVPPVRDEESETQRKAHAKHVRQTRRSTQGVTLDDIRSAEQLVKKINQPTNNNNESSQTVIGFCFSRNSAIRSEGVDLAFILIKYISLT